MPLSFTEKRTLQKTITSNLTALAAGDVSFTDKRRLQKGVTESLAKLNAKVEIEPTQPPSATGADVLAALPLLRKFINSQQLEVMIEGMRGEEGQFFRDKMVEMAKTIESMPKTYDTDGQGDSAVAVLHYFRGGSDWYITEKDKEPVQEQAFGYTILNGDTQNAETGYISIVELIHNGVEIDLHWNPKTLGAMKGKETPESEDETQPVNQDLLDLQTGKFDNLDPLAFLGKLKQISDQINDVEPLKGPALRYLDLNAAKITAVYESAVRQVMGEMWGQI